MLMRSKAMRSGVLWAGLAVAAAGMAALVSSDARAFTIEGGEAGGAYEVPQFNLEEQARSFRRDGSAVEPGKASSFDTPLGKATVDFGARQGSALGPAFGMSSGLGVGWSAGRPLVTRQDFERMVTPENLR